MTCAEWHHKHGYIDWLHNAKTYFDIYAILIAYYVQTEALDEAERKRLQRNARRVKRRAEMTDEQGQEINRKQREYRARKKAESSYTPNAVQTPSSVAGL